MILIHIPVFDDDTCVKSSPAAWTVRVEGAALQAHTFACQVKDGCFVSAHTKLAGWDKHVVLSTEALANDFRAAIFASMRKRHGDFVELTVEASDKRKNGTTDDVIVLARIRERNFAPNKSPKINDPDSPSTSVSDGEGAVLKQGGVPVVHIPVHTATHSSPNHTSRSSANLSLIPVETLPPDAAQTWPLL